MRQLRVAGLQLESRNGEIAANLEHAVPRVEEAAERGAQLVVLPEFYPTGYVFTREIWDAAEPRDGMTVRWLCEHAKRLGVHLGTSFLEADGEDFYNTFVLATPSGELAGRVRKQTPAAFEAYFTRGDAGSHVIETSLGRIGVGICYENQLCYTSRLMIDGGVDLMLMPHSAPTPSASVFFPRRAVRIYDDRLRELSRLYAEGLGIPVVFVNKTGPWETSLPGLKFLPQRSSFPGFTSIADSDGRVLAQLGAGEGIVVEDVTLDPARKKNTPLEYRGRWAIEVPWAINTFRAVEAIGSAWYQRSQERKERAIATSRR